MPDLLRHPIATFRNDFDDMTTTERVALALAVPVASFLGAITGVAAVVAALTLIPA